MYIEGGGKFGECICCWAGGGGVSSIMCVYISLSVHLSVCLSICHVQMMIHNIVYIEERRGGGGMRGWKCISIMYVSLSSLGDELDQYSSLLTTEIWGSGLVYLSNCSL